MFQKKDIKIYIVMIITSLLMCIGYISGHYSTDNFNIMDIGYHKYSIENNLREGRPIMTLIDQLYDKLNISYDAFFISTVVIAIILTCINIVILYNILEKYTNKKDKIFLYIVLFSTIFNFMYLENLYFVESIVMANALVFYTLSAKEFFKKQKGHYLKAILYATIAIFSYNGLECYYIALIGLLSILENKKVNKQVLIDILKAGFIIIFTVLLNFIQMRLACNILHLEENRAIRVQGLINILYMIFLIPSIITNTSSLFPPYLYLLSIILLIAFSILYEKKTKEKVSFNTLFLILISIVSCFCIGLVSTSAFGTGRLLYGIGMSTGLAILYLFMNIEYRDKTFRKMIIVIGILWTLITITNYTVRSLQSKKNNEIEKEEILKLDKEIKQYEKDNNIKITKVICARNYDVQKVSQIDEKALRTEWSSAGVINYYTKRNIKRIKIKKKENEKYLKKVEDTIYVLEDDTIIINTYEW